MRYSCIFLKFILTNSFSPWYNFHYAPTNIHAIDEITQVYQNNIKILLKLGMENNNWKLLIFLGVCFKGWLNVKNVKP